VGLAGRVEPAERVELEEGLGGLNDVQAPGFEDSWAGELPAFFLRRSFR